jgi:hypothetical protein
MRLLTPAGDDAVRVLKPAGDLEVGGQPVARVSSSSDSIWGAVMPAGVIVT